MHKHIRLITLSSAIVAVVGGSVLRSLVWPRSASAVQSAGSIIQAPSNWVAFSADMRRVEPNGRISVVGRYYRAIDGSTRLETGHPNEPITVVSISNVTTSTHYEYVRDQWHSYLMRLPSSGLRPALRVAGKSNRGMELSGEVLEGLALYRFTSPGGVTAWQAPALNFFSLRSEFGGTREEYWNIAIRQQEPEVFAPPVGADVQAHQEFRGIVTNPTVEERERFLGRKH
jgi:hypothetical protein